MAHTLPSILLRRISRSFSLPSRQSFLFNVRLSIPSAPIAFVRNQSTSSSSTGGDIKSAFKSHYTETEADGTRFREFQLDGRVFVVTGAGGGLSLELAEGLVEAGGHVYCLDRKPEPTDEFYQARDRVAPNTGGSLHYNALDVRDAENVNSVLADIASKHSRLDGLIAGAAIQKVTPAIDYPPEAIDEMMAVNYKGVYISAVAAARQMIKYRIPGSILLIASMSGIIANRHFTSSVYNSSKAAVIQLARSLAMEWGQIIPASDPDSPYTSFPTSGPDGSGGSVGGRLPIRVNALCPGNILTPMVAKNFEDDPGLEKLWKDLNMLGRLSRPREYRGVALFALSDASSFMTGSSLVIDGGYTAW